jgi:CheY-like chemotaxis protein
VQKLSIDQILQAGWYLLRLINEILDLAMIESGKVSMSHEPMSLTDVLQDCEAMIKPQADQRQVQLHFPQLDAQLYVHADRVRVKQVMTNLLSNAIKYNREGGSVKVTCQPVSGGKIRINVSDTGLGLSVQQLAQMFQPFNRLGRENSAEEGTGIGLVVTKQLVELMGGEIGVESQVGVGSVFWIELIASSLPELESALPDVVTTLGAASVVGVDRGERRTLLYVEDNPANLILVEQLIARRADITLLSAIDGHSGIQMARAHRPDVILMDINLPGISGYGALKILHSDPATRHIPVMALSANAMPRDIDTGLQAGFFRYLTKPIDVFEFMDALDLAMHLVKKHGMNVENDKQ